MPLKPRQREVRVDMSGKEAYSYRGDTPVGLVHRPGT